MSEQVAAERASTAPVSAQVGGRGVLLVPHRAPGVDKWALPPEYQRILAVVQQASGPVMTRQVGEALGPDTEVRGALEPLRGKLTKLADRGRLRKLPGGKSTARL
ncbi:hypothetical protein [Streptomyces mirabilis]|uniref:hypothetical protein n=1 Tax=Streptomyces mirabilis TaxID=68239 RepID=UPI003652A461